MAATAALRAAPATRISARSTPKRKRNLKPLNRLLRIYLPSFSEITFPPAILAPALGRVFSAVAQGQLKPKAATALAYLGQTLNQSVKIAQDEYANVFGGAVWRRKVASCFEPPPPAPVPKPASQPARPAHPPHRTRTSTLVTLIQLRRGRRDFTPTPVGEAGRCSGL